MEFHALLTLSLPLVLQDALIVVAAGVALLASLAFINLEILLPGLLTSLGGPQPDQRGAYLEFGPAGAPIISEPAPPWATDAPLPGPSQRPARPHLRHRLWRGMALHLTPPRGAVRQ
jgi:hypothetical protein